jgi:hypothetical protein
MKKEQESLNKDKSLQNTRDVASETQDLASGTTDIASTTPDPTSTTPDAASGTPDVSDKPEVPKPGTSGTWGGGWNKPVTDLTPEEHLNNQ